ncbi:hypothetical protein N665_0945s0003 [Sinapis alba]|nr:hypothetical protein N665_0945s0003 [Sinapis alba]
MKILHWNCQGLRISLTIPHLKDIRKSHNPDVMFLVETKNVDNVVHKLAKYLGYQNVHIVYAVGSSGGAALFWNDRIAGYLQNKPRMFIGDFNDIKNRYEKQGGIVRCKCHSSSY